MQNKTAFRGSMLHFTNQPVVFKIKILQKRLSSLFKMWFIN